MDTYESILRRVTAVPIAPNDGTRDIQWIADRVLAAGRDESGRLEIFLPGPPLLPASVTVRDAMQHHDWHRSNGTILSANRILLPALGHFDHVGAFICTELLRNGAADDMSKAFATTEPIIELAIARLQISENAMLGLLGELLLLHAMLNLSPDPQVGAVLLSWEGWRRSKRDFVWNSIGIEVKTTRRSTSTHRIQGVHQIDPIVDEEGQLSERRVIMVSISLSEARPGYSTFSIPVLVARILERLQVTGNVALIDDFLDHVADYGTESGFGYDHRTMAADAPFTEHFAAAFVRGYDMSDPQIRVIRHDVLTAHNHVEPRSVSFTVNLPAVIAGQNPTNGVNQVARNILGLNSHGM